MHSFYGDFEKCCGKHPDNKALCYCDNNGVIVQLSYEELFKVTDKVSESFNKYIENDRLVGIAVDSNLILPCLIVGLQKNKSPFYCIDHCSSDVNFEKIVEKIKLKYLFTSNVFGSSLEKYGSYLTELNILETTVQLWKLYGNEAVNYGISLSYVIQTSGTTGNNKIVHVTDDCIMSNVKCLRELFKVTTTDTVYFGTPVTFDPFIIEIFLTLTSGACLLIVPNHIKKNYNLLLNILFPVNKSIDYGATILQLPPSLFLCYPEDHVNKILNGETNLRILALGGEKFPEKILNHENRSEKLQIFNLYGITEVSCWATANELKCSDSEISLGDPLNDTIIEIRDNKGNVITEGEGELFIGSSKRICFIDNEKERNGTIFRSTGDLVCVKNNEYYYKERIDNVIKRLGNKISLSEIEKRVYLETQLNSLCLWDNSTSKLILFMILKEYDRTIKHKIIDKIRIKLLQCLPKESNPDVIELISSIPLTKNGKCDSKHLLNLIQFENSFANDYTLNEIFENIFSKYFGLSYLDLKNRENLTFSELGGNSILAIQISTEFDSYFKNPTKQLLTMLLENKTYQEIFNEMNKAKDIKIYPKRTLTAPESRKKLKLSDHQHESSSQIKWLADLEACVDSTPVVFKHGTLGDLVAIGCHSKRFLVFHTNGDLVFKLTLKDAVEGSVCMSPCNNFAVFGCNEGLLYCVDIENKTLIWKFKTDSSIKCTPTLSSDRNDVMFGSYNKSIYRIALKDGNLIWKQNIRESVKSSPVVHNKRLFIATLQGTCLCLRERNGVILWKNKMTAPVFGSPCLINEGTCVLWIDVKGHLSCFDSETGKALWRYGEDSFVFSSLCMNQNSVLFGSHNNHFYYLECSEAGCKQLLKVNVGSQITSTPCVFLRNDALYFVIACSNGDVRVYNSSGVLTQNICLPGEIFSSPVVWNDEIFVGCRNNHLYCIQMEFEQ